MLSNLKKRNIIILIDDYIPYSSKIAAKMMHELAYELVKRENQVTVVTPYNNLKKYCVIEYIDNIEIVRFKLGKIKNCSFIKRTINESLMPFKAWFYTKKYLENKKYNLIISYSPSIFWGLFTIKIKNKFQCSVYLILRDFFPQWIIDIGIIKDNTFIAKYFRFIEKINYKSADIIGIQSPRNIDYFKQIFGEQYNTKLLFNWINPKIETKDINFKKNNGLDEKVLFFYGGNIGKAQDTKKLVKLSQRLQHKSTAHFVFLGQGDEFFIIKKLVKRNKINNITILPKVSQKKFNAILKEVDIGMFSLNKNHKSHNFPGKILGYMVNSIPILGIVNPNNDLKDIIEEYNAGFVSINGEDDILYKNALTLLKNKLLRKQLGINSNRLLHKKFTVYSAIDEILNNQG
ncbi:putative glycosyl transferase [Candidatus Arsenophonus lipoptenae]|uniref:Putative glycosyl transferase n=1 Tax=Candidatus Arsenophonus lipoptenae TaxID=634113 RepID=A0A0X9VIE9_9GAMM|nr:glycosyltransferase family 4 protein [Candidatus Arsenophonus lipoptenae]AMA64735.1 putative glycosyl transferase [Candidatus Arsenophonus lipoptenae]